MKQRLIFYFFSLMSSGLLAGTPPPPPSNPGTVPIDDYIGMLIIIGAFAGFLVVLLLKKYRVNNLDEI